MALSRVSTSGTLAQTLLQVRVGQSSFQDVQYQVSTGFRYRELKDYGDDAKRVVDLTQSISSREAYNRAIDIASLTTDSYDVLLERFADLTKDLIKATDPTRTEDLTWADDTLVIVENMMLELQNGLNTKVGDRYIFAGANYATEPVRDIRNLELYSVNDLGRTDTLETANDIPIIQYNDAAPPPAAAAPGNQQSYMNAGPGPGSAVAAVAPDQFLWQQYRATVDDGQTLDYGITATSGPFQQLVDGLLRLKSATQAGLTVQQRVDFVNESAVLAETALTGLRQMQSTNGVNMSEFQDTMARHNSFINISASSLANLTQVDTEEAAVVLSALSTQIQASYAAIARRENLSLINFLS